MITALLFAPELERIGEFWLTAVLVGIAAILLYIAFFVDIHWKAKACSWIILP